MKKIPNRDSFLSLLRCRGELIVLLISLALWLIPTTRLVIWKLAESNLFLVERTFFEGSFFTLGGPLDYLARALTTFLASGWTAMPSIALTWCLLTALTTTISQIKGHWFWLNALPGFMILTLAAHMGFGIWVTQFPHLIFQIMLGMLIVLLCYWGTRSRSVAYTLVPVVPLYLACGGWSFLYALLVMLSRTLPTPEESPACEVPEQKPASCTRPPSDTRRRRLHLLLALLPVLLVLILPYALIRLDLLPLSPLLAYMPHVLLFKGQNWTWNLLFMLAIFSVILIAFIRPLLPGRRWISLLTAACTLGLFLVVAEKNPRLGMLLAMEKATKEAHWREILSIGKETERPHRMMAAYRILALYKTDRIADDLFMYPVQTSHQKTSVDTIKLNGPLLLYEYGLVLNARKALMEDVVDYGYSAERLRLLGMISCVTLELGAAYAYFEKLSHQPFYRKEAEHWLHVLQGDEKPPRDLEHVASLYTAFKKAHPQIAMGPSHRLEEDIYTSYQTLKDCPPSMAVFYLMITLLEKTPNKLALNLDTLKHLQKKNELPLALQEGLLFHLATTSSQAKREELDYASLGISTQTLERWNAFLTLHEKLAASPKQLQPVMCQTFGKTYWYYHIFIP